MMFVELPEHTYRRGVCVSKNMLVAIDDISRVVQCIDDHSLTNIVTKDGKIHTISDRYENVVQKIRNAERRKKVNSMAIDTSCNPRVYVIYGMDKIWGIADTYPELDKLCQYLNKSSRKDMLSDFEIVVFDGKKVVGRLPFSRHTDLLYPEHLVFKTDF